MRERDDLTFTMDEHRRRLAGVRERMAANGLDALIVSDPENLFYLTEYQTTGYSYFQALVVPLEGEPCMVTRLLEETNVVARTWVEDTAPYPDTGDAIETLFKALRARGLNDARIGYERNSYFFPAHQQDRMVGRDSLIGFEDQSGLVEELRMQKSDAEIDVIRSAASAADAGMKAGLAAVCEGVTENELAAEISAAMFRAGGEYPAVMPYVTSGPRCLIGHATWEGRRVEKGDTVFLEVGGCMRRYHAALMRTAHVGPPPDEVKAAEALVLEALDRMVTQMAPGMPIADADRLARDVIERTTVGGGLVTRAGYSIGIAFAPSWDEGYIMSLKPDDTRPLPENSTFHIIPWLFDYAGGRVMGISETVVVRAGGAEALSAVPRALVVAG